MNRCTYRISYSIIGRKHFKLLKSSRISGITLVHVQSHNLIFQRESGHHRVYPYDANYAYEACTAMEKRQRVTLRLDLNTTFPDNYDQLVQFRCSISTFPGLDDAVYSHYSESFLFAGMYTCTLT